MADEFDQQLDQPVVPSGICEARHGGHTSTWSQITGSSSSRAILRCSSPEAGPLDERHLTAAPAERAAW